MKRIALVSCREGLRLDEDLPPLVAALGSLGAAAEVVVWDDPAVAWAGYDLAVVRSAWDYAPRRDEFLAWAERVSAATRLANPAPVLRWNTDKRYLRELAEAGTPVVPTHWIAPGDPVRIPFDGQVVVKPAVSAGSIDTARHAAAEPAAAHARRIQASGRTVMVQPYLARLDEAGETGMVYMSGVFSHAFRKGPLLRTGAKPADGLFLPEEIRPREPSAAERRLGNDLMARHPGLLYARVDIAPGPDGGPLLLEFETTEPSLFFAAAPGSAERFARAILRCPS